MRIVVDFTCVRPSGGRFGRKEECIWWKDMKLRSQLSSPIILKTIKLHSVGAVFVNVNWTKIVTISSILSIMLAISKDLPPYTVSIRNIRSSFNILLLYNQTNKPVAIAL